MIDTSEKNFEATIEQHLLANGYRKRKSEQYDRALCLDTDMLFEFIYATQPKTWEKLKTQHGDQVKQRFLARLVREIESRGTLDVLRNGVVDLGSKFNLAYFRPETRLNEEHVRLYNSNILSVMRQVRYSRKNDNSLDLVLFLNGLPILTVELKNPLKGQTVQDAMAQYRRDRDPKEPLFKLGRCLAHFAVDTDLVYMTTHLRGTDTQFLPFNKGRDGGAGNPSNPDGFSTAYLWEEIWQRDTLLDIINHFLQLEEVEDDRGRRTGERRLIFPRYHQLTAVRNLVEHARANGPGRHYLVQHSAGSGKSNSIAWLTHRLIGLHDAQDRRVFDSVIVITDRVVLDRQLQRTVRNFEQVRGLVTTITGNKAQNLANALAQGDPIIVTTLQTFPFVHEKLRELAGRRFAVIIDEAHSSQSGEGTTSLKQVLSVGGLEEADSIDEGDAEDAEDVINRSVEAAMRARGRLSNVSLFAFTATPKNKTLELFGTRRSDGTYAPFSLYSMRQAIEEGFILDVLKNYTTFKVYFGLLKKIEADPQYPKPTATYLLRSYVDLHEHAIRTKTQIMLDHFHTQVRHRIPSADNVGQAKVMLVTRSRLHAVRYKQAFERYIKEKGYPYRALVAFSGTVRDPDTGLEYTESEMNGFPESQTAEAFKSNENRILIVANKFQTGFDQPLLHTMYVDKKLGGVNAVQTLSRLNRPCSGKEETFVLDFANRAEEIERSFRPYYQTTILSEATDPNKLYDLKRILEGYHLFGPGDVDAFVAVYFSPTGRQERLHPVMNAVVDRYVRLDHLEQTEFRKHLGDYVRIYAFLGQIITFQDPDLEKLYQFARHLSRRLPVPRAELPVEITQNIRMDTYRVQQTSSGEIKILDESGELRPISDLGTGQMVEEDWAPLSEIVEYMNEYFGTEFIDEDKVSNFADDVYRRLTANQTLRHALDPKINPSAETRRMAFENFLGDALDEMMETNFEIYKKIVDDAALSKLFASMMFERVERSLR